MEDDARWSGSAAIPGADRVRRGGVWLHDLHQPETAGRCLCPWRMRIVAAWLTAFTVSFDEFALALFLAGTEPTFPVYLYSQLRFANRLPIMIALAVLMMIGTLTLVLIAERIRRAE